MAKTIEQKVFLVHRLCEKANTKLLTLSPGKLSNSLMFECPIGHKFSKRFDYALSTGAECQECKRYQRKVKKNTARARAIATKNNAVLVTTSVKSTKEKIQFKCARNHAVVKSIDKLSTKPFCGKCSKEDTAVKRQAEQLKFIKSVAKERGLHLLSPEYTNNTKLMEWKCSANHKFEANWSNVQQGGGCPYCAGKKVFGGLLRRANGLASKNKGSLLSKEVKYSHDKLKWRCENGHSFEARLDHVYRGSWCFECAHGSRHTIRLMQVAASARGGRCVKKISGTRKFLWECAEKHRWEASSHNVYNHGQWCPHCSTGIGERFTRIAFETIFQSQFPSGFFDWLRNPETGRKMQLDGFNEALKIAFEHQGYTHYKTPKFALGSPSEKQAYRDQQKREICRKQGITLIEVPEVPRLLPLEELTNFLVQQLHEQGVVVPKFDQPDYLPAYSVKKLKPLTDLVNSRGGRLVETVYKGATTPHLIECKLGHQWSATPHALLNAGTWCPVCAGNKLEKPIVSLINEIVIAKGGKIVSTSIKNTKDTVIIDCGKGHQFSTRVEYFLKHKNWCRACHGRLPVNIERAKSIAKNHGGDCVKFIGPASYGSHKIFRWICSRGHEWEAMFNNVQKGQWCQKCKISDKETAKP